MSTITTPKTQRTSPATTPDPIPTVNPPKPRRRPLGLLLSVGVILAGSLLALWAWTSLGSTTDVLAVRAVVHRGEVIDRADLMTVRVGLDPAVKAVPATELDAVVGQRAALDLAPGGLVSPDALTTTVVPASGESVVGIALAAEMLPADPLAPGDRVRAVQTPGTQGEVDGPPKVIPATVVSIHPSPTVGETFVDVLVPADVAAELAAHAATGRVALVLDSRER